jgi:hypothetical protein
MRLWCLHPTLLDAQGLVALWREALLAQKVLHGQTKGYRQHPQLQRFRSCGEPLAAIATYLWAVHDEAVRRGYAFNAARIAGERAPLTIPVRRGQLAFEWAHLKAKLRRRAPRHYRAVCRLKVRVHPLFTVVAGAMEPWERGRAASRGRP